MDKNNINDRESRVLDFINAKNNENSIMAQQNELNMSPTLALNKLNSEYDKGKSICIDTLLGRLYRDALPYDDPKRNRSDAELRDEMHDYISKRTNGKSSEYYVREAIKRTNSHTLKGILTESENIAKKFVTERRSDIGKINIKDLNFDMNMNEEEKNKITKKLEFDEISTIIRDNVQNVIKDESDRAKKEEEYNKSLEDMLANDNNVMDDTSMESAIEKLSPIKQPTVYEPSLFEAILLNKSNTITESTGESIFNEAVYEFTKLNISKALKLEKFDLPKMKKMVYEYMK